MRSYITNPVRVHDIPEGFQPLDRGGPFLRLLGPLYHRRDASGIVIAIRVEERHLNVRGIAHGGMLVTLADSALGIALSMSRTPPQPMVTVSLTTDFADVARAGDWLEAHVDIQKVGSRMAFANCYLWVGERRILRASGVFALVPPARPQEGFEG
jgi:acyl-coenzyme A thioesterase 13